MPTRYAFFTSGVDLVQWSPVTTGTSCARALPVAIASTMHAPNKAARI